MGGWGMMIDEPRIRVGLVERRGPLGFVLRGPFADEQGRVWPAGDYSALAAGAAVQVSAAAGGADLFNIGLRLSPVSEASTFVVRGVVIGISFHWQQEQDQEFAGGLQIRAIAGESLLAINEVPLETYLASVISSEMSSLSNPELLRAHAIISRSWLLAQIAPWRDQLLQPTAPTNLTSEAETNGRRIVRWYDREGHDHFDVCADDHCQRYQGVTRIDLPVVTEAVCDTRGMALVFDGQICDARFSKSCGGMTERFSSAWQDADYPYLSVAFDGLGSLPELHSEDDARRWIRQRPPAYCNTEDREVLQRILPSFDQPTTDFYRWQVRLSQEELHYLLTSRLGIDPGSILRFEPLRRGGSGRLILLRLVGERQSVTIGKELEIRRVLSRTHLYSSAFVVEPGKAVDGIPEDFTLYGAGWGHGVGLCQIGAAVMAARGFSFRQILAHYYRGAGIIDLYRTSLRLSSSGDAT